MKAYAVTEECESTGGIVFAEHPVVARRLGANEFNNGEFSGVSCRRAPWADAYVGNAIPVSVMIDHGWHFECWGCGERIDEDWLRENDLPLGGVIGTQHSAIYCCEICQCRDQLRAAIKRDHERRAIKALKQTVARRFPGVVFSAQGNWSPHAYATQREGTWYVAQAVISFDFPGMKYGSATCRIEREQQNHQFIGPIKPEYSCCFGDKEAFDAWVIGEDKADATDHRQGTG